MASKYTTLDQNFISSKTADLWLANSFTDEVAGDNSWRKILSKIGGNAKDSDSYLFTDTTLDALNVDENVYLVLDNGFPEIKTNNKVSYPFENFIGSYEKSTLGQIVNLGTQIYDILKGVGNDTYTGMKWNPWIRNAPAWEGTEGIFFSYTFSFALGEFGLWNAFEEVVKPIANLMAPCLPRRQGVAFTEGPWPNSNVMLGKIIRGAGEEIWSLFKNAFTGELENTADSTTDSALATALTNILTSVYNGFSWNVKFGDWMTFYKLLIKDCTIKFSKKVDTNGWPIQGSITLNFKGITPLALRSHGSANLAAKFGT